MRISSIEGMRAIFALWVLIGHVIGSSGFAKSDLWIGFQLLETGIYAVYLFMIISGFVIFLLLDNKKENYLPYLTRRFFRLFPVFIVIFVIAIPTTYILVPQNAKSFSHLFVNQPFPQIEHMSTWWANIETHVIAHILMLHGLIPENVAPAAPIAFLGPAWSISLEWQFYLVAPLFFYIANRLLVEKRDYAGAIAFVLLTLIFSRFLLKLYPTIIRIEAFLPYSIHFFMIGWASYFVSKYLSSKCVDRDLVLLFCLLFAAVIALTTRVYSKGGEVFPFIIWLLLFPFVVTSNKGFLVQKLTWILENNTFTYLGRISYSIYLTHRLLIIIIMKAISPMAHQLNSTEVLLILMPTTVITTLVASAFLYRFLEAPGIKLGVKVSSLFKHTGGKRCLVR